MDSWRETVWKTEVKLRWKNLMKIRPCSDHKNCWFQLWKAGYEKVDLKMQKIQTNWTYRASLSRVLVLISLAFLNLDRHGCPCLRDYALFWPRMEPWARITHSAITQQLSRSIFAQIYFRGFGYLPDIFILFSKFYLRKISRDFALAFVHQILDCIKVIKTLDTFQRKLTLIAKGLWVVTR